MATRLLTAGGLLAVGLALVPAAPGDDKPGDKSAAQAEAIKAIPLAIDLGRHGTETKSPLELVTAAAMLAKYGLAPSKAVPAITEGPGAKTEGDDAELPPLSLKAETAKYLAEARRLAGDDKEIAGLIARVEESGRQTRASGMPQSISRKIRMGVTHTYTVAMAPGTYSAASVVGNGTNSYTLTVTGNLTGRHGGFTGPSPAVTWTPGRAQQWTIAVTNNGPGMGTYTLNHN